MPNGIVDGQSFKNSLLWKFLVLKDPDPTNLEKWTKHVLMISIEFSLVNMETKDFIHQNYPFYKEKEYLEIFFYNASFSGCAYRSFVLHVGSRLCSPVSFKVNLYSGCAYDENAGCRKSFKLCFITGCFLC